MIKKTIYLVEDDDDIREMLQYLLKDLDCEIVPCHNAAVFWKKMQSGKPNLVIMDIMLPDDNGAEIGKKLNREPSTADIPILFMSANLTFQLPFELDAHEFISKPFDVNHFMERVTHLLN